MRAEHEVGRVEGLPRTCRAGPRLPRPRRRVVVDERTVEVAHSSVADLRTQIARQALPTPTDNF
jgi:ABC-type antimicrobial peptide transport system ATPase subunit